MNKETVPIHQLIPGLFTTIPTPINNIGFWSLVEYFQKETNTQLTGSYEYITLYTPGKYIEYDYGNGCWKFKKDYSLNSIINVDEKPNYIEIVFSKEKSNSINYEDLFVKSLKISREFQFKYKNNLFYIKLLTNNLDKSPIYYLNELLKEM